MVDFLLELILGEILPETGNHLIIILAAHSTTTTTLILTLLLLNYILKFLILLRTGFHSRQLRHNLPLISYQLRRSSFSLFLLLILRLLAPLIKSILLRLLLFLLAGRGIIFSEILARLLLRCAFFLRPVPNNQHHFLAFLFSSLRASFSYTNLLLRMVSVCLVRILNLGRF